jgi:hypothetical protein
MFPPAIHNIAQIARRNKFKIPHAKHAMFAKTTPPLRLVRFSWRPLRALRETELLSSAWQTRIPMHLTKIKLFLLNLVSSASAIYPIADR